MTVIVKYDQEGKPQYRSARGVGSTEAERARARQLDALLKKELTSLKQRLIQARLLKKNAKGNVELYWELGNVLWKVFFDSQLIDASEKHLYWLNARLHVPEELLTKDRGPNRLHLEYCFRLAGFPRGKAMRMKWGEWVYLFDRSGINREQRFDKWLEEKMQDEPDKFSRDDIRILAQTINGLLGNKETKDLLDEQLRRCYEAAWFIKENFRKKAKELPNDELKEALKVGIEKNYTKLGEVINGTQEAVAFALLVAEQITRE
jgi:hypothetical protein